MVDRMTWRARLIAPKRTVEGCEALLSSQIHHGVSLWIYAEWIEA
jgi:hypothetical protein